MPSQKKSQNEVETLQTAAKEEWASNTISEAVPAFKVENFPNFDAHYALKDGAIIIHFYLPANYKGAAGYWKKTFPDALSNIAPEYFQATAPRLVAAYTEELRSWWLRAKNYDHLLDLDGFILGFFQELDNEIDSLG